MKSTEFMLGNKVAFCDDHEPDFIIAIEESMLHLSKRKLPDDERDIEGIPLTDWINKQTKGLKRVRILVTIKGIKLEFAIKRSKSKAILLLSLNRNSAEIILIYHHQLQNLLFVLTGQQFNPNQEWDLIHYNNNLPSIG
jgi:hypothetical protein